MSKSTHRPLINYNSNFVIKNERSVFRQLIKTGKQGVFVFNYLLSIKELSLRNGLGMRKTIPSTLYQRYGLDMVGVKGFEPPTSCSQTHVLASCSFRYAPSGAFSVLFSALVPTVSMWFSSVCGRRCGQKSPPCISSGMSRYGRIRFAYCSLGFSGCQVNVSTFSDK